MVLRAALGASAPNAEPFASFPEVLVASGWIPLTLLRSPPARAFAPVRRRLAPLAVGAMTTFARERLVPGTVIRVRGRVVTAPARELALPHNDSEESPWQFDLADDCGHRLRVIAAGSRLVDAPSTGSSGLGPGQLVEAIGLLDQAVDPSGARLGRHPPLIFVLRKPEFADLIFARVGG